MRPAARLTALFIRPKPSPVPIRPRNSSAKVPVKADPACAIAINAVANSASSRASTALARGATTNIAAA